MPIIGLHYNAASPLLREHSTHVPYYICGSVLIFPLSSGTVLIFTGEWHHIAKSTIRTRIYQQFDFSWYSLVQLHSLYMHYNFFYPTLQFVGKFSSESYVVFTHYSNVTHYFSQHYDYALPLKWPLLCTTPVLIMH